VYENTSAFFVIGLFSKMPEIAEDNND